MEKCSRDVSRSAANVGGIRTTSRTTGVGTAHRTYTAAKEAAMRLTRMSGDLVVVHGALCPKNNACITAVHGAALAQPEVLQEDEGLRLHGVHRVGASAISIAFDLSATGLPIGVTVARLCFSEGKILALAAACGRAASSDTKRSITDT